MNCETDLLRDVSIDGFRLRLWEDHAGNSGAYRKTRVRYSFEEGDGTVIFEGNDFWCSPVVAIDSDAAVRSLLCFLTLRPGDTDRDYFAAYTPRQWAFVEADAEALAMHAYESTVEDIDLCDDGTMDTVFACRRCCKQERYSGDHFPRDESGAIVAEDLVLEEVFEEHECQPFDDWVE